MFLNLREAEAGNNVAGGELAVGGGEVEGSDGGQLNPGRGKQVILALTIRQNLLHVDTLNMMTKYQLVYIKLETAIHKILETMEKRKKMRIKKAFLIFRRNSLKKKIDLSYKKQYLSTVISNKLKTLEKINNKALQFHRRKFFNIWASKQRQKAVALNI